MAFILKSDRKESINKTIRFPLDLVGQIEQAIVKKMFLFQDSLSKHADLLCRTWNKKTRINILCLKDLIIICPNNGVHDNL